MRAPEVENDLQALKIFGVTQQEIDDAQHQGVGHQSATGRALADRRHGGAETGDAGSGDSGRHDGLLHDQRYFHGVGAGPYLRSRSGSGSRRRCSGGNRFVLPQTFHGIVSYIEALIDPATRTTSVRIVTKNPEGLLKKDMFVDAVIHTRSGRSLLAVPTSAILRNDENLPFVYVEVQPGKFAQRLVNVGASRATRRRLSAASRRAKNRRPGQRLSSVCEQQPVKTHMIAASFLSPSLSAFRDHGGARVDRLGRGRVSETSRSTPIPTCLRRTSKSSRNGPAMRRRKWSG